MYHSLIHQGGVGIGQRVLVLGVGGLGIHGVQIARSAGAEVLATSRQPQRVALAEQYGAVGIDTALESLEAAVARFTDGEGVDVVVDNIGNRASVRQGLAVLRPGGKLLVVAYLDETFEVPSMPLFKTEQQIIGCRGSTKQDLIDVVRLVRTGQVTPVLGASYALEQIERGSRPPGIRRPRGAHLAHPSLSDPKRRCGRLEMEMLVFIGTYTDPILFGTGKILQGKGEGIYVYRLDPSSGSLEVVSKTTGITNPSYLAFDATQTIPVRRQRIEDVRRQADRDRQRVRRGPEDGNTPIAEPAAHARDRSLPRRR